MFRTSLLAIALGAAAAAQAEETGDKMEVWRDAGNEKPTYTVKRAAIEPELRGLWNGEAWLQADIIALRSYFEVSKFQPRVQVRALHGEKGIYVHFKVDDQFVLTTRTEYHGEVWKDSCAEFFVQPKPDRGYFNFEINSGGTMLLSYHEHPEYAGEDKSSSVPWDLASTVQIYHSLPRIIAPESSEPINWQLEYFIPYSLLETYVGPLGTVAGQQWRANFYKCAEDNSHPHWGTWAPIFEKLDFHQPRFFGVLQFEE